MVTQSWTNPYLLSCPYHFHYCFLLVSFPLYFVLSSQYKRQLIPEHPFLFSWNTYGWFISHSVNCISCQKITRWEYLTCLSSNVCTLPDKSGQIKLLYKICYFLLHILQMKASQRNTVLLGISNYHVLSKRPMWTAWYYVL